MANGASKCRPRPSRSCCVVLLCSDCTLPLTQIKEPVPPKYGLPPSYAPHVRLGWGTDKADLQTPLGFDGHGFSYRDISDRAHPAPDKREEGDAAGSVFHTARGRVYGEVGLILSVSLHCLWCLIACAVSGMDQGTLSPATSHSHRKLRERRARLENNKARAHL